MTHELLARLQQALSIRPDGHNGEDLAHEAQSFIISSADEMISFGRLLGKLLLSPRVVALRGDLGAGKTTMAKGMVYALTGIPVSEITSPTFQYVQFYKIGDCEVAHFDLWRLRDVEEFMSLGLEEYLSSTLAIIEWPERIYEVLPQDSLFVDVSIVQSGRLVTVKTDKPS